MLVSLNKLKQKNGRRHKQSQINPMCSPQLSLFQRNNMVNLCICSMQVHQSRFSLLFFPIFILSGRFHVLTPSL